VLVGALAFSALFAWVNTVNYTWLSPLYERTSSSTLWGIIQRLYLIIPCIGVLLWKPRQIGLQIGNTTHHWRMLSLMLCVNMAVIGVYLFLTGGTPYSGLEILVNEVITVPFVEEVVWRGIVFSAILAVLDKFLPENQSGILSAIYSGICFGLLHSTNALLGYPLAFVALQTLNATVWGIVYGIARAKSGSIYPPMFMHAAMNLLVVLA